MLWIHVSLIFFFCVECLYAMSTTSKRMSPIASLYRTPLLVTFLLTWNHKEPRNHQNNILYLYSAMFIGLTYHMVEVTAVLPKTPFSTAKVTYKALHGICSQSSNLAGSKSFLHGLWLWRRTLIQNNRIIIQVRKELMKTWPRLQPSVHRRLFWALPSWVLKINLQFILFLVPVLA